MRNKPVKLGIIDDHTFFRGILVNFLNQHPSFQIAIQASDVFELLNKLKIFYADILVLDVFMPKANGSESLKLLRREYPDIKVVVLSTSTDLWLINELLDFGIHGYISKADEPENLVQAILAASEDKIYRNNLYTEALYLHNHINFKRAGKKNPFDEREKKILQLLWEEKSNKDIANEIFLSVRSVEKIRQDMKEKLGVKSTIGLLKYALSNKLIEDNNKPVANCNN
jgi:DNA-binding NarL/FixJ family response regulator